MQVSIVNHSELERVGRIDAEYYRKEILDRINVLECHHKDKLENLVDFIIGPFGSTITVDQYVDNSKYRYVRNKDINDFVIKDAEPALISCDVYHSLPKYHIQENDLLITVVGTLGKVAIATKKDTTSIFSCKSTILRAKNINPFYLLAYLNTNTGKLFSLRGKRGAIQEGLNLPDLREIQVLCPSSYFQLKVENTVRLAFSKVEKSMQLYKQAQDLLLAELGLANWQPKHQLTFVKNYSDAKQVERMDAEYFQPKYDDIINTIKSYSGGWDMLGNLIKIKDKNCDPKAKQRYQYIELANIGNNGEITDCMIEDGENLPTRARRMVVAGDVIVSSIEGSLTSIALIENEYDQALCSTGFHVVNSQNFNPETLLVMLKSLVGQLQLKKGCSGTILTAINKEEFSKIVLPKIARVKQTRIQQKIIESFNLRKQSKHLLEYAKKAVEIAIEQDEQTAIQWLENETEEMQI